MLCENASRGKGVCGAGASKQGVGVLFKMVCCKKRPRRPLCVLGVRHPLMGVNTHFNAKRTLGSKSALGSRGRRGAHAQKGFGGRGPVAPLPGFAGRHLYAARHLL